MTAHIESARSKLGQLGAMASQNEAAERKILARAEKLLDELQSGKSAARGKSISGGDSGAQNYADIVMEEARLKLVIARAKSILSQT